MNRDGANESLWQSGIPAFVPAKTETLDQIFDVIIVGGGITGVSTALELQRAGQKCLIAEAKNLCFGTSGGTTAHLNNFFDKTYSEIESDFGKQGAKHMAVAAGDALALYKKNINSLHIDCDYAEGNGVLFAQDEKQAAELDKISEASTRAGIPIEQVKNIPISAPFIKAVAYPGQGQIHPVKYVYGLAKAFESLGGIILELCFVNKIEPGDILEFQSPYGTLKSKKLIYATHIPPGINLLHMRCAPYRSYVLGIELQDDGYPENPAYDMMDPYHYYRTHLSDGKKWLIAGGEDHKTGHEENTELPFVRLEDHLRKIFKIKNIGFKWSSQYFEPADGLAYIGHLPGAAKNMFVATGFGGNGMTYSHITANYFKSLFTENKILYDDLLSPSRVKPIAGFSSFIKENTDVVTSLIADRFKLPKLESIGQIPHDQGEIVKYENHAIAIYKDKEGEISSLHPACTHLKCMVKWNQTEKSWDCPCHGARYGINGEVLTGPSTSALEKITSEQ
jgi:glycine/D-amino acid oxidase-like deaminating enzyme/nitrite reductase/ring-hydroxylating ferredoxin subunit